MKEKRIIILCTIWILLLRFTAFGLGLGSHEEITPKSFSVLKNNDASNKYEELTYNTEFQDELQDGDYDAGLNIFLKNQGCP